MVLDRIILPYDVLQDIEDTYRPHCLDRAVSAINSSYLSMGFNDIGKLMRIGIRYGGH